MICNFCQCDFDPPHHNSKCCSDKCRLMARRQARAKYNNTPKGAEAEKKWRSSTARKLTEEKYRSKPETKALACDRVLKYQRTSLGKVAKMNADHRRRMAVKAGRVSADDWARKLLDFDCCCAACGASDRIQMDHIHPLSKGGAHHIDNVQPLCGSCNASKGASMQWAS